MPDVPTEAAELRPTTVTPGAAAARLLLDASWVNRRKDAVQLLDDAWVHRQTSIDFTLTDPVAPTGYSAVGLRWCVPLTLLGKVPRTLMRFDVLDEAGHRLPLPTRRSNALASYAALRHAARMVAGALGGTPGDTLEVPSAVRQDLLYVALADRHHAWGISTMMRTVGGHARPSYRVRDPDVLTLEEAEVLVTRWERLSRASAEVPPALAALPDARESELRDALAKDEDFLWLVDKLALSSVVMVTIDGAPGDEKLLRLAYDETIYKQGEPQELQRFAALGWRALPLWVGTAYAGAQSYHFEFEAPEDIEVVGSQLADVSPVPIQSEEDEPTPEDDDTLGQYDGDEPGSLHRFEPRRGGRVHLYAPNAEVLDEHVAQLRLRVRAQSFTGSATLAAAGIGVLLAFYAIAAEPLVRDGTSATSLLLIFTGVFGTIVSRAHGHAIVARMLRWARWVLLVSVACAVAGAAALVVTHTGSQTAKASLELRLFWGVLAATSLLCAATLNLARILPRPRHRRGRAEGFVDWLELRLRFMRHRRQHRRQRDLRLTLEPLEHAGQADLNRLVVATSTGLKLRLQHHGHGLAIVCNEAGRPITARPAKPEDELLRLTSSGRSRLSATLAEAARRLPCGFALTVTWGSGDVREASRPPLEQVTLAQLQALVARDDLRIGRRYELVRERN